MSGAVILFHPAFEEQEALDDRYWRAVHYLGAVADRIETIVMPSRLRPSPAPPVYLDPALRGRAECLNAKLSFEAPQGSDAFADIVILWDQRARARRPKAMRVATLDPGALHEGDLAIELGASLRPPTRGQRDGAQVRLARAIAEARRPVVNIFGTGPSLATAKQTKFEGEAAIVCNSAVKDIAFLERLQPAFIAAIDPVFHAGPSRHAAIFRQHLEEALKRIPAHVIVQERDAHLYEMALPPSLASRILPVPVVFGLGPNLCLPQRFSFTATRNVLTLAMLPLAFALGEEIRIFGCDGRPFEEADRFWSYDASVEFTAELAQQRQAHPGFFTLDYQDYYALHCETTRVWIAAMEKKGRRVSSATESFIPALAVRAAPGLKAAPEPPPSFALRARLAYAHRLAQSGYGALLSSSAAPRGLKRALRACVSAARLFAPRRA